MSAVRLLSTSQLLAPNEWTNRAVARLVDVLAWLLPDLDRFTSTAWLMGEPPTFGAVGMIALETLVYGSLLVLAGLFDLHRKNL
jgi:hypothetical protein